MTEILYGCIVQCILPATVSCIHYVCCMYMMYITCTCLCFYVFMFDANWLVQDYVPGVHEGMGICGVLG